MKTLGELREEMFVKLAESINELGDKIWEELKKKALGLSYDQEFIYLSFKIKE